MLFNKMSKRKLGILNGWINYPGLIKWRSLSQDVVVNRSTCGMQGYYYCNVQYMCINFSSYSKSASGSADFDLFAVSNHSGTLHGGHYTASCRHPYKEDSWNSYNDRSVSGSSKNSVISYEAYLLFFEKRQKNIDIDEEQDEFDHSNDEKDYDGDENTNENIEDDEW